MHSDPEMEGCGITSHQSANNDPELLLANNEKIEEQSEVVVFEEKNQHVDDEKIENEQHNWQIENNDAKNPVEEEEKEETDIIYQTQQVKIDFYIEVSLNLQADSV